jgi:hypothetical protein
MSSGRRDAFKKTRRCPSARVLAFSNSEILFESFEGLEQHWLNATFAQLKSIPSQNILPPLKFTVPRQCPSSCMG